MDPESEFYIQRQDDELGRLRFELSRLKQGVPFKAFLCGHGGSGKTTELKRLAQRPEIRVRFLPVTVSVQQSGKDTVDLTHDALKVEIGLALLDAGREHDILKSHAKALEEWGRSVVKTYLKRDEMEAEAGAGGTAWLAWFKATLKVRRSWDVQAQQQFEPRVSELVALVDRIAQDIENRSGRRVLVLVDDLEKGDSEGHRTMHLRLFSEHYETLVQPVSPLCTPSPSISVRCRRAAYRRSRCTPSPPRACIAPRTRRVSTRRSTRRMAAISSCTAM